MVEEGTRMTAESIDDEGYFHHEGKRWSLLGSALPVPADASVSGELEHEEVLAVVNIEISKCVVCGTTDFEAPTTVVMTEHYRLVPSRCCNKIIWYYEGNLNDTGTRD